MAAGENQKLKMLYLVKILSEETDEAHGLSAQEIIARLADYGVNAERKTLYTDLEDLERYGLEILRGVAHDCGEHHHHGHHHGEEEHAHG